MEGHVPNLGGIPERFKKEGLYVHGRDLIQVGESVEAICNVQGQIVKGATAIVSELIVEPNENSRGGFYKRLRLEGISGEFNPKKFKKK